MLLWYESFFDVRAGWRMAGRGKDRHADLDRLNKEAVSLMAGGEWRRAMEIYDRIRDRAYPVTLYPAYYNNYALCLEKTGEPERALETLAPNLDPAAEPSPFAHALAAHLLLKLGRAEEAEAEFGRAMEEFTAGLEAYGRLIPEPWREQLLMLQTVAGERGDARLVLEMHRKWEHLYLTDRSYYLAGVAAFNLGRLRQAVSYWRSRFRDGWADMLEACARVAAEVERGLLPPFRMSFNPPDLQELAKKAKESYEPSELVEILASFAEDGYAQSGFIREIILHTGDWGEKFARNLAKDAAAPRETKVEALAALVESGRHPRDEPFALLIDGRLEEVKLLELPVVDVDVEGEAVVERALALRDAGKPAQAEELLRDLLAKKLYPAAALTLANLLRARGELDEAGRYLEIVAGLAPDDPRVLYNLCGYHLQRDDLTKAREYFARIDPGELEEDFRARYEELRELLAQNAGMDWLTDMDTVARVFREEVDDKPIGVRLKLAQGLRRLPAEWLTASCAALGLPAARRKEERAAQLAAYIAANTRRVKIRLAPAARECLAYLLAEGGWAKLSVLERRFGSTEGDGYFWTGKPPASAVGLLRLYGLVYVGRHEIGGRRYRVAVVPEDLREKLG
ncbi:MAG: tetratricopeptide repeat protein [Patescibacteria group bacterium]